MQILYKVKRRKNLKHKPRYCTEGSWKDKSNTCTFYAKGINQRFTEKHIGCLGTDNLELLLAQNSTPKKDKPLLFVHNLVSCYRVVIENAEAPYSEQL